MTLVGYLSRLLQGRSDGNVSVLPRQGTTGAALVIVMTIMSFLACLAIWAVISIAAATAEWTSGIANTVTVQIKPPDDGPVPHKQIAAALEVIKTTPGVEAAQAIDEAETARLLEPWLGTNVLGPELPLSALISVTLSDRRSVDFNELQEALDRAAPGATVDDHTRWTARLLAVSRSLIAISLTVLTLVLLAATAIIVFATRAGLMAHSSIVEILHLSGAQGEFIAGEFERHFLRLGFRAGLMGLGLALATLAFLYFSTEPGVATGGIPLVPRLSLTPVSVLALLAVPIAAAFVATLTARLTVLKALETMP